MDSHRVVLETAVAVLCVGIASPSAADADFRIDLQTNTTAALLRSLEIVGYPN
jgi:hypothetical protein